jgi:hypothetical protein
MNRYMKNWKYYPTLQNTMCRVLRVEVAGATQAKELATVWAVVFATVLPKTDAVWDCLKYW